MLHSDYVPCPSTFLILSKIQCLLVCARVIGDDCCSEVASLNSVYYRSDIQLPTESEFSNQLHAHREGHTTIRVTVSANKKASSDSEQQIFNNEPISDEIHIQVNKLIHFKYICAASYKHTHIAIRLSLSARSSAVWNCSLHLSVPATS